MAEALRRRRVRCPYRRRPADGFQVDEVLAKAARELARGIAGESDSELQSEWLAYWFPTISGQTLSISRATGTARRIVVAHIAGATTLNMRGFDLVAESNEDAREWASALGGTMTPGQTSVLDSAGTFIRAPMPGTVWTTKVRALLEAHCSPTDVDALNAFLGEAGLPATIVLSLPEVPAGSGRRLVAVRFDGPDAAQAKSAAGSDLEGAVTTGGSSKSPRTTTRPDGSI